MRRRSLNPPRTGVTHSRYSPSWTRTVSPACASAAAALIVRSGALAEPSALSDPVVATWYTVIALVPLLVQGWSMGCRSRARVATERQHTAVLGVGGHAERLGRVRLPSTTRQVRRPEAYVALRPVTVLIQEQIPDVVVVITKEQRALQLLVEVRPDPGRYHLVIIGEDLGADLVEYAFRVRREGLLLGDPVDQPVLDEHRGIDDVGAAVDEHTRRAQLPEVRCPRCQHPAVSGAQVIPVLRVVKRRGPEQQEFAPIGVVEGLGRPRHARRGGCDLEAPRLRPRDQIRRAPHDDVPTPVALPRVPAGPVAAVDTQVGGDDEELVRAAHEVRVTDTSSTQVRPEHWLPEVQPNPRAGVVAVADREMDLLPVSVRVLDEMNQQVSERVT